MVLKVLDAHTYFVNPDFYIFAAFDFLLSRAQLLLHMIARARESHHLRLRWHLEVKIANDYRQEHECRNTQADDFRNPQISVMESANLSEAFAARDGESIGCLAHRIPPVTVEWSLAALASEVEVKLAGGEYRTNSSY